MKETGSAICRGRRVIGVVHSHPSGSSKLSSQDIRTALDKKLKVVCVKTERGTKCYKFRKNQG